MSSILVFAKPDNTHPNRKLDHTRFKRGDVIDVQDDDDFHWGSDVQGGRALGWWKVIVVRGVSAAELLSLLNGDLPADDPAQPRRLRTHHLNLDQLEKVAKAPGDGAPALDREQLMGLIQAKPALSAA